VDKFKIQQMIYRLDALEAGMRIHLRSLAEVKDLANSMNENKELVENVVDLDEYQMTNPFPPCMHCRRCDSECAIKDECDKFKCRSCNSKDLCSFKGPGFPS